MCTNKALKRKGGNGGLYQCIIQSGTMTKDLSHHKSDMGAESSRQIQTRNTHAFPNCPYVLNSIHFGKAFKNTLLLGKSHPIDKDEQK